MIVIFSLLSFFCPSYLRPNNATEQDQGEWGQRRLAKTPKRDHIWIPSLNNAMRNNLQRWCVAKQVSKVIQQQAASLLCDAPATLDWLCPVLSDDDSANQARRWVTLLTGHYALRRYHHYATPPPLARQYAKHASVMNLRPRCKAKAMRHVLLIVETVQRRALQIICDNSPCDLVHFKCRHYVIGVVNSVSHCLDEYSLTSLTYYIIFYQKSVTHFLLTDCDQQRHFHYSTGGLITEILFCHLC